MTLDEFLQSHNGRGVDVDGNYGNQCMDLYLAYQKEVFGLTPQGAGCAKLVWNSFPSIFEKIPNTPTGVPQKGDVVIWGMEPCGHIAIATGIGDTNTFQTLDQNWISPSNYQTRPAQLITHNYNNVLGWLRPKGGNMDPQRDAIQDMQIGNLNQGNIDRFNENVRQDQEIDELQKRPAGAGQFTQAEVDKLRRILNLFK